jgi:hypothetical protein
MAKGRIPKDSAGGVDSSGGKLSAEALARLDDEIIAKVYLRPERPKRDERTWWRKVIDWFKAHSGE